MYMCRETIRRATIQKFNEIKGWKLETFTQLYNKIDDIKEANDIINSLKICDPAVGSGHFLVSALNEIIAIKNDLKILIDRDGKRLKEYQVQVVNDELIVTDEEDELFEYNPNNKETQRVQEALFHEKQELIENCLFGVDINPNSVKICRLRLWIELLKNAYYTSKSKYKELETLPNIDINIKQGNSLISRFPLDADLTKALRKSKWNVDTYKIAIHNYHHANSKDEKREIEKLIETIKSNFETEIANYSDRSKVNSEFPEQQKIVTSKPLLRDVVVAIENRIKSYNYYEVDYNIEIKSSPETDKKFHPSIEEYSELIYKLMDEYIPLDRLVIQSFDFRVLKYWHEKHPEIRLSALIGNTKSIDANLELLGFHPAVYSPEFKMIDKAKVQYLHSRKIRVIPWTVNEVRDMLALKGMGVDGLITDYPNRSRRFRMTLNIPHKGGR